VCYSLPLSPSPGSTLVFSICTDFNFCGSNPKVSKRRTVGQDHRRFSRTQAARLESRVGHCLAVAGSTSSRENNMAGARFRMWPLHLDLSAT
jgi:hypothetical protein